jgi:hypothetical protein
MKAKTRITATENEIHGTKGEMYMDGLQKKLRQAKRTLNWKKILSTKTTGFNMLKKCKETNLPNN